MFFTTEDGVERVTALLDAARQEKGPYPYISRHEVGSLRELLDRYPDPARSYDAIRDPEDSTRPVVMIVKVGVDLLPLDVVYLLTGLARVDDEIVVFIKRDACDDNPQLTNTFSTMVTRLTEQILGSEIPEFKEAIG